MRFSRLLTLLALLAAPASAQLATTGAGSVAGGGGPPLPATANLVFEGDSITLGLFCNAPANYPTRAILQLPSGPTYTNTTIATSGISSITLAQGYSTRGGAAFNAGSALNMLMFMAGTNTTGGSDTNAGQKYWWNRSYLRQARNTGYQRIVLGTLIARDDDGGTFWTNVITPLNTYQRTYYNSDMQADALMDWGNTSPYFTPASAALNQTYYNTDFLHPIAAGCQQMANVAAPPMTTSLSAAGTQVQAPLTWSPFSNSTNGFGGFDGTAALSTDFRTITVPSGTANYGQRGFPGVRTGKYYWEVDAVNVAAFSQSTALGIVSDSFPFNNASPIGSDATSFSIAYATDGGIRIGNAQVQLGVITYQGGDNVGIAADFTNKLFWARRCRSGTCQNWNGGATANPATGVGGLSFAAITLQAGDRYYPAGAIHTGVDSFLTRFAASQLTQTAPSGFNAGFGP